MKKFISFILAIISIFSISILFTGCGTQTVDDITGEYIEIEDGKELKKDNKHYYTETSTLIVKENNQIILNDVQYKKISSKTVTIDDTNYTAKKLIEELVKIPKFYEMDDTHISDPIRGFTTELRQYVNY